MWEAGEEKTGRGVEQPRRPEPRPGVREVAQRHRKAPPAGKGQRGSVPGQHVLNQDRLGLNHTPPRGTSRPTTVKTTAPTAGSARG